MADGTPWEIEVEDAFGRPGKTLAVRLDEDQVVLAAPPGGGARLGPEGALEVARALADAASRLRPGLS